MWKNGAYRDTAFSLPTCIFKKPEVFVHHKFYCGHMAISTVTRNHLTEHVHSISISISPLYPFFWKKPTKIQWCG